MKISKALFIPMAVLMAACILIVAAVYFVCHLYLDKMSTEALQNWLQSERVEIQEGNLLNAITKNQRVLTSSEFIKGVTLIDLDLEKQNTLIAFGENITPTQIKNTADEGITSLNIGLFKQLVVSRIPSQTNLAIAFHIDGRFLRIIFALTSFGFVFIFILATGIIYFLQKRESLKREQLIVAESKGKIIFAEMAARVAHDIRSPMGVLGRIESEQLDSAEGKAIITQVIGRLQNITDDLIKHWKNELTGQNLANDLKSAVAAQPVQLNGLIADLIAEKKKLYQHLDNITFKSDLESDLDLFPIDPFEFNRHLSNLVDNAVESVGFSGEIILRTKSDANLIEVQIKDNGRGIPEEILPQIGKEIFSFGKSNGSGQGVYYARNFVKSMYGELKIESTVGIGSSFTFLFPKKARTLLLPETNSVAYVDDDPLAKEPWMKFIKKNAPQIENIIFFKNSSEYLKWAGQAGDHVLFSDYNLKENSIDGLQLISRAPQTVKGTCLVTNSFDDPGVQLAALAQGVSLLPKTNLNDFRLYLLK